MARYLHTQYSFSNGEINPRFLGRTDIKEYYNAATTMQNYAVGNTGGANQCRGSILLDSIAEFTTPSFVIYKEATATENESNIAFSLGNTVTELKVHEILVDPVTGSLYMEELILDNNLPDNLSFNGFVYGKHITKGLISVITDKNGTFEPIVLEDVRKVEGNPNDFTLHLWRDFASKSLSGTTEERYRFRSVPFDLYNTNPEKKITVSNTGGLVTAVGGDSFTVDDIGRYIRVFGGVNTYYTKIINWISSTQVGVFWVDSPTGIAPDGDYTNYALHSWTKSNYPRLVDYYQGRFLFANTNTNPERMWFSRAGNVFDMHGMYDDGEEIYPDPSKEYPATITAISDLAPFFIEPDSEITSPIKWVVTERYITYGTGEAEYILQGIDGVFSTANSQNRAVSKYGSGSQGLALYAQNSVYFVERDGKTVREMSFSEENGGYISRNIGILGPEMGLVVKMEYDYSNKRLYLEDYDKIVICTLDPAASVTAWSTVPGRYSLGGLVELGTDAYLLVSNKSPRTNTIYELISFYTEGEIEAYSQDGFPIVGDKLIAVVASHGQDYALSSLIDFTFVPGITTAFIYDNELGSLVEVVINEALSHPSFLDGTRYVTYGSAISLVALAKWSPAVIETIPFQQGSELGDGQMAISKIDKASLRLYKTPRGIKVGATQDSLEELEIDDTLTGIVNVRIDGYPKEDFTITIQNDSPLPSSITGMAVRGTAEEG